MSQFIEMFGSVDDNPKSYDIKKVGDFAECFAGATPSTKISSYWDNGNIPWMSSGEVHKARVQDTDAKITQQGYDGCSTKMVPIHSIVIALAGQGKTRGTVAINDIELCTNQSLCAIVPNEEVNYEYLFHNLRGRYKELRSMSGDVDGRGGLNLKHIQSIKVIVPPMSEQMKFVSIARQADKSGFDGRKSQFIEMFGGGNWPQKTLGEVGSFTRGGGFLKSDFVEHGIPCIHYGQIHTKFGPFITSHITEISSDLESKTKFASKGDLVIAITSEDTEGSCKSTAWLGDYPVAVGGHAAIYKHSMNPLYMSFFFKSTLFNYAKIEYVHGTKVFEIKPDDIAKILVPCPPMSLQNQFSAIAEQSDKSGFDGRKSQFIEMFGDPVSWQTDTSLPTLNDTVNVISGFPFDSEKFDTEGVGTPLIRIRDIQRGYSETFTTEVFDEQYRIKKYELLVGMDGMFDIARWQSDEAALNQRVCCLRMKGSENDTFIQYLVQPILKHIEKGTNATTVKHISTKQINGIRVPIASHEQKNKFAMIANQADKSGFRTQQIH